MIGVPKEKRNKSLKKIQTNQTVGRKLIKLFKTLKWKQKQQMRHKIREFWKRKNLDGLTGDPYANITNRKEEIEERIVGIEDMKEGIDTQIKMINL